MESRIYISLAVMGIVTFAVRAVPLTLIRGRIKSRFWRSFLFYVPYVTLSVMTFPSILSATRSPVSGVGALAAGLAAAWFGAPLFSVAASCCAAVLVLELFCV